MSMSHHAPIVPKTKDEIRLETYLHHRDRATAWADTAGRTGDESAARIAQAHAAVAALYWTELDS